MGKHPINLFIRFILEAFALISFGMWGWSVTGSWFKYILGIGIPTFAAVIWGIFTVPNDPSRSGKAPVPVPGYLRLLLEMTFFGLSVWAMYDLGNRKTALLVAIIVLLHYGVSYDRIMWLFTSRDNRS